MMEGNFKIVEFLLRRGKKMKYHLKSSLPKKYNQGETNLCWAACLFCALDILVIKIL